VCVPFGARVDAGLLSERPARGRWQIDATCQRYGCKFIATSAKEDKVNGKCQEAVDVASILSAYPQCRYPGGDDDDDEPTGRSAETEELSSEAQQQAATAPRQRNSTPARHPIQAPSEELSSEAQQQAQHPGNATAPCPTPPPRPLSPCPGRRLAASGG
jgi:hypothetical protein